MEEGKTFYGKYREQMPSLIKEGFRPYTFKDVMQERIEALQSKDENEINFWLNQHFDTSTGLAYHDGKLIVIPDSELLKSITSDSEIKNYSLILTPGEYEQLSKQHEVIERDKVKQGTPLTKEEAKQDRVWINLSGNDQALLNEYVNLIFAKVKKTYKYDENMGIYLPGDQKAPGLRAWFAYSLDNRSSADARVVLVDDLARLFGVRAQNLETLLGNKALELGITNPEELEKMFSLYSAAKQLVQQ